MCRVTLLCLLAGEWVALHNAEAAKPQLWWRRRGRRLSVIHCRAGTFLIPAEMGLIPVGTGLISAGTGLIPARTGLIPLGNLSHGNGALQWSNVSDPTLVTP